MVKFDFDGPNKKIIFRNDSVVGGVATFTVADLWREWCDWAATGDNLKYAPAFDSLMVPLSATEYVGPYLFMRNDLGWVGVPPAINPCTIIINGSFFGTSPTLPVMENLEAQATDLVINRSVLTNTVVTSGVSGPTAESIAAATVAAMTSRLIDNGLTNDDMMRLMASILLGKVSGTDTSTIKFRDLADTTDRITATVDASGNRTAITYDLQ